MSVIVVLIIGWFALSVPVSLVVGQVLGRSSRLLEQEIRQTQQSDSPAV
jgi:hypothetical protein